MHAAKKLEDVMWARRPAFPLWLLGSLPGLLVVAAALLLLRATLGVEYVAGWSRGLMRGVVMGVGLFIMSLSYAAVRIWYASGTIPVRPLVDGVHVGDQTIAYERISRIEYTNQSVAASIATRDTQRSVDAILHLMGPKLNMRFIAANTSVVDFEAALATALAKNPSIELVPIELFERTWKR